MQLNLCSFSRYQSSFAVCPCAYAYVVVKGERWCAAIWQQSGSQYSKTSSLPDKSPPTLLPPFASLTYSAHLPTFTCSPQLFPFLLPILFFLPLWPAVAHQKWFPHSVASCCLPEVIPSLCGQLLLTRSCCWSEVIFTLWPAVAHQKWFSLCGQLLLTRSDSLTLWPAVAHKKWFSLCGQLLLTRSDSHSLASCCSPEVIPHSVASCCSPEVIPHSVASCCSPEVIPHSVASCCSPEVIPSLCGRLLLTRSDSLTLWPAVAHRKWFPHSVASCCSPEVIPSLCGRLLLTRSDSLTLWPGVAHQKWFSLCGQVLLIRSDFHSMARCCSPEVIFILWPGVAHQKWFSLCGQLLLTRSDFHSVASCCSPKVIFTLWPAVACQKWFSLCGQLLLARSDFHSVASCCSPEVIPSLCGQLLLTRSDSHTLWPGVAHQKWFLTLWPAVAHQKWFPHSVTSCCSPEVILTLCPAVAHQKWFLHSVASCCSPEAIPSLCGQLLLARSDSLTLWPAVACQNWFLHSVASCCLPEVIFTLYTAVACQKRILLHPCLLLPILCLSCNHLRPPPSQVWGLWRGERHHSAVGRLPVAWSKVGNHCSAAWRHNIRSCLPWSNHHSTALSTATVKASQWQTMIVGRPTWSAGVLWGKGAVSPLPPLVKGFSCNHLRPPPSRGLGD